MTAVLAPPPASFARLDAVAAGVEQEFTFGVADFERVRQLIYQRAGISLHAGKQAMVYSRLSRRLRETAHRSFADYLQQLEQARAADPEWQEFVNCLTTNLTAFFREEHHFDELALDVRARDARPLRIWCNAASTKDGERILPGHAYIAPGGLHLWVEKSGANYVARVQDGEPVNRHKPSVEVLFRSAARVVGPNAIALMLTGMGADGARAMKEMRDAGSYNYVQDEASCVVFGMPREAIAAGAAHEVLPLSQIAPKLIERLKSTSGMAINRV